MTDLLATPSIRVTRIHGKHTYVDKNANIKADVMHEEGDSPEDRGRDIITEICHDCHGVGITPGGDPCDEAEAWHVSLGYQICNEDEEPIENLPCSCCHGNGILPIEFDAAEERADYEYHKNC